MRRDLKLGLGKSIAQGCHASMAFILADPGSLRERDVEKWLEEGQTKVCVRVDDAREFWDIKKRAEQAGLRVNAIQDAGRTQLNKPTWTCLAIGPNKGDDIDKITGHLKLL
jgi:PTH2 family peptidyl-tRNA hydrolase